MTTPTSQGFSGAGSIHALLAKFTKLNPDGSAATGPNNVFYTDSLVSMKLSLTLNEPKPVKQTNGAGLTCMVWQAPNTIDSLAVDSFDFCTPDPRNEEFLAGGVVIAGPGQSPVALGYAAPKVGVAPKPNGVAVELYSRAVVGGSQSGFFRWLFPLLQLSRTKDGFELGAENPLTPTFGGVGAENPKFGAGADGSWSWISDRVFQYVQVLTLPDYAPGYASETVRVGGS